jgi:hypothetical protein
VGDLGFVPFVKAFSALWLGLVAIFFGVGAIGFIGQLVQGHWSKSLPLLLFAGVAVGFAGFFVGLTTFGSTMDWLAERLQSSRD